MRSNIIRRSQKKTLVEVFFLNANVMLFQPCRCKKTYNIMDVLDCCDICGEGHTTHLCPELGLDVSLVELDQVSTRARLTLPIVFEVVDNGDGLVGVIARENIPAKTQFGPFEAKRTTHIFDDFGFFTLKLICKDGSTVCLDTTDENECNWMCLVRAALSAETQNCMAYQLGTNIFFSTTREIYIGEELQVWYATHFARKLNKPTDPDGETKVLLGHRIEPLVSDLFGDTEPVVEPTELLPHNASPKHSVESSEFRIKRGEIKKACYCPRCGNTFGNQSDMVQHLREHVIAGTLKTAPSTGKKRGPGRPRVKLFKVSDVPKRRPGRPRKITAAIPATKQVSTSEATQAKISEATQAKISEAAQAAISEVKQAEISGATQATVEATQTDISETAQAAILGATQAPASEITQPTGQTVVIQTTLEDPQPGEKRKHEDDDVEEDDYEGSEDEALTVDIKDDSDDEDLDKDYNPMKDVRQSTRQRVQPKRARKGKNTWLCADYVVSKTKKTGSAKELEEQTEEMETNHVDVEPEKNEVVNKTVDDKVVKRGRGRPKKIKDMVGPPPVTVIEIVNDTNADELIDRMCATDLPNTGIDTTFTGNAEDNVNMSSIKTAEKDTGSELEMVNKTVNSSNEIQQSGGDIKKDDIKKTEQSEIENAIAEIGSVSADIESVNTDVGNVSTELGSVTEVSEGLDEDQPNVDIVCMVEESGKEIYVCVPCQEKFEDKITAVAHCMSHDLESDKNKDGRILSSGDNRVNGEETGGKTGEESFPCDICHQAFKTAQYLYRHMVMHTDVYNCVKCRKTFSRKDSLQKHVLKCCPYLAENYRIYSCSLCTRVFSTRAGYQKHSKKCQSVQCKECNKVFSSSDECDTHKCKKGDSDDMTGRFACGMCSKTFQSLYYLKQHISLHKKLHACERCGKHFVSLDELDVHRPLCETLEAIKHFGTGKCIKCELEFSHVKHFREHYLSHSHPYQCDKCQRRFVKIGTLTIHDCQRGMASEEFTCHDCSKTFKSQVNLDNHIKQHGCMKYECTVCGEQFHMKAHAKNHLCNGKLDENAKLVNISHEKEICEACGKSFSNKSNLTKHMLLHGEKMFECPHCEKKFHLDVYLKDHIACVHFNIYKFQCTHCGKMLKSKTGLIAHNKLFHSTKVETHPCPKCGKVFKQKGNLRTHMFSHSTERKFSCAECSRTFKYPDQLSRHKIEHRQVNKLSCPECDKTFYKDYEMRKHIQIYHSGYVYVCAVCTSRCGHRHTLIRHYKRKHPDESALLSQEGYIDGMLKHLDDIYPNPPKADGDVTTAENGQPQVTSSTEMLSRDAAEALHSLALGTVTARQYQILKDKGLFKDPIPLQTIGEQVAIVTEQSDIVSEEGGMVQHQEVVQPDQIITEGISSIATVSMDTTMRMFKNKDGTININGLQGISQNIEGLENSEGQIVILQIVDPESQEVSGIMQGEVIQQIQTGEGIQAISDKTEQTSEDVLDDEPNALTISEDNAVNSAKASEKKFTVDEQQQIIPVSIHLNTSLQNGQITPVNQGHDIGGDRQALGKTTAAAAGDMVQVEDYLTDKQEVGDLLQQREGTQVEQEGEDTLDEHGRKVFHLPHHGEVLEIQEVETECTVEQQDDILD